MGQDSVWSEPLLPETRTQVTAIQTMASDCHMLCWKGHFLPDGMFYQGGDDGQEAHKNGVMGRH